MKTLIHRSFVVNISREKAWAHLTRVQDWPSWAPHIKSIQLIPAGELGPASTGLIHLNNGIKSAFQMSEFDPPRHWKWVGKFLWLTIEYDHIFEELSDQQTKLTWLVEVRGFGRATLGRLFAWVYNKNLNAAIPKLIQEMNTA
jgi:polyketide cyclase/dehydrase/lipid transport protein